MCPQGTRQGGWRDLCGTGRLGGNSVALLGGIPTEGKEQETGNQGTRPEPRLCLVSDAGVKRRVQAPCAHL